MRILVLIAALLAPAALGQVTVTFQDGVSPTPAYAGTRDLIVKEGTDEAWSPTTNYDTFGETISGPPDLSTSLVRFDLAAVPAGSVITAARLTVYSWGVQDTPVPMFEVLKPWVSTSATFNAYDGTNPWEVAGAQGPTDRGSTVLAAIPVDVFSGPQTMTLNAAGVAVIQRWLDGASPNDGFIFQDYTRMNGALIGPLADGTVFRRPYLELDLATGATVRLTTGTDTVLANGRDPMTRNYDRGSLNCDGSPRATSLIAFDLSSIPPWATVLSAGFIFENVGDGTTGSYPVYEELRDWSETEATWLEYRAGSAWSTVGGNSTVDHGATALGTLTGSGLVSVPLNTAGIGVVQQWVAGTKPNRGFHFISFASGDGIWMGDREGPVINERPQLLVTYREGALAFVTAVSLAGAGSAAGPFVVQRRRDDGTVVASGAPQLSLTVTASSPTAELSLDGVTGWTTSLSVPIGAGLSTTTGFYLRDSSPGDVTVTANGGAVWTGVSQVVPVRRVQVLAPSTGSAGSPLSASLQLLGGGGAVAEARPVELELSQSTTAGWGTGDLSVVSTILASGTTAANGSASMTFSDTKVGTVRACARIAGAPGSGDCVDVAIGPAAAQRALLSSATPSQVGCAAEPVALSVVDSYGNLATDPATVDVCLVQGPAPVIGATTFVSEQRSTGCVSGIADGGVATIAVSPSAPGTVRLSADGVALAGDAGLLDLTWTAGAALPEQSSVALQGGGSSAVVAADGGVVVVEVLPRDGCGFNGVATAGQLGVLAPSGWTAGPFTPIDGGFAAPLTLDGCPGSEAPVTVHATLDGLALPQSLTLTPDCAAPAFVSTPSSSASCGTAWTYSPALTGDGPFTFALSGVAATSMTLDATTGAVSWTPASADRGTTSVQLQVSGPGGAVSQSIPIEVACSRDDLLVGCGCQQAGSAGLAAVVLAFSVLTRRRRAR